MTEQRLTVALVTGEVSGDRLGISLAGAIRAREPSARIVGVVGSGLAAAGVENLIEPDDIAIIGFGPVLRHLPRLARRIGAAVRAIVASRPDVLVIIDSPGFTHIVARRVARRLPHLPIINYVAPQVWAWRSGRARTMRRYIRHVLALLPFEPAFYAAAGGPPCTYVGHPLVEMLAAPGSAIRGSGAAPPVLVVLPGSRRSEVAKLMAPFGETVRRLAEARPGLSVLLPAVDHLHEEIVARAALWHVRPQIVRGEAGKLDAFRRADAALAASGTVTLELGLARVPMAVAYKVEPVARLFKSFLNAHSIVLTNLALGENAVPEFLDDDARPERLAGALLPLLADTPERRAQLAALDRLAERMQTPVPPSERAADIVLAAASEARAQSA